MEDIPNPADAKTDLSLRIKNLLSRLRRKQMDCAIGGQVAESVQYANRAWRVRLYGLKQQKVSTTQITIAWDPSIVDPEDYAELVNALGDLVRNAGGNGVRRVLSDTVGITANVAVPG